MKNAVAKLTCVARLALFIGLLLLTGRVAAQSTYYVSQSTGQDKYDGLAQTWDGQHGPWQTLARASSITYRAGDKLLLKCGDTWNETLTLHGDGDEGQPITIASYSTGRRPFIHRTPGKRTACIIIDNASGYALRDLELGHAQNAIRFSASSRIRTTLGDYLIENCFLHNTANPIFPDASKNEGRAHNDYRKMGWAIFADAFESPAPVRLKNLTVRHCCGVRTQGFFMPMGPITLENVLFDGNTVSHNSFNSVYQIGAKGFDIVNSVFVYGYPWEFHPNGTTQVLTGGVSGSATVRNEVTNNEFGWAGDYPGRPDGCAYDFEGSTSDVTFQNNFIHDTFGEAVLFMPRCKHVNLVFDSNIFRNNVRYSPTWNVEVTLFPNNTGNGTFSNNIFFPRPGKKAINSKPSCFTFENNQENATGSFVEMPLVTKIECHEDSRTYTLACKTPGATIHYTHDGSLPTTSSAAYTEPVTVDRSGVLNCKAFQDGLYPSSVNSVAVSLRDREGSAPVANWKLDESSGSTVTDSVSRISSELSGCTWTKGKIDSGLQFDGTDDAVSLASGNRNTISDTFTISFWVNPQASLTLTKESSDGISGTSGQRFAIFPQHGGDRGDAGAGVSVGTNGIIVFEHATDYLPSLLVDNCSLSGWNHIAVVYRNKQPTLYLNGVYEKAGCKSAKTVHPLFDLGGSDYGWFDGALDDVRVYDRALTDAEIQVLANAD